MTYVQHNSKCHRVHSSHLICCLSFQSWYIEETEDVFIRRRLQRLMRDAYTKFGVPSTATAGSSKALTTHKKEIAAARAEVTARIAALKASGKALLERKAIQLRKWWNTQYNALFPDGPAQIDLKAEPEPPKPPTPPPAAADLPPLPGMPPLPSGPIAAGAGGDVSMTAAESGDATAAADILTHSMADDDDGEGEDDSGVPQPSSSPPAEFAGGAAALVAAAGSAIAAAAASGGGTNAAGAASNNAGPTADHPMEDAR